MAKILNIETSTALCSVALSVDGRIAAARKSDLDRKHASLTAVFCDQVLREAGFRAGELDAVCVSDGPGSYTGLRVGLSTAKGLCFGAELKLLSVSSLDVLAAMGAAKLAEIRAGQRTEAQAGIQGVSWAGTSGETFVVPMIDARRMEVYTAVYKYLAPNEENPGLPERISDIEARIIVEGSFADIAAKALFIGDGAMKCKEPISAGMQDRLPEDISGSLSGAPYFIEAFPEAAAMGALAEARFAAGAFRDVAYFEPFYLKEFTATVSKKKLF